MKWKPNIQQRALTLINKAKHWFLAKANKIGYQLIFINDYQLKTDINNINNEKGDMTTD